MRLQEHLSGESKIKIIDSRIQELEEKIKFLNENQYLPTEVTSKKPESISPYTLPIINKNPDRDIPFIQKSSKPASDVVCSIEDFEESDTVDTLPDISGQKIPEYKNNRKSESTIFKSQKQTGLEKFNITEYQDDPFEGLSDNMLTSSQRRVPQNLKFFTFLFIFLVFGTVGAFIYKNSTETDDSSGQNNTRMEKFQTTLSNLNAKETEFYTSQYSRVSKEDIPEGVTETDKGYFNNKYKTLYIHGTDDKITILESTWKTQQGAEYRLQNLKKSGLFGGKIIKIVKSKTENNYSVIISDYATLEEANQDIVKYNF